MNASDLIINDGTIRKELAKYSHLFFFGKIQRLRFVFFLYSFYTYIFYYNNFYSHFKEKNDKNYG
ncbi:hypothetical protein BpHYR1_041578 [Brachionus plicatilis]|uniref:Uncharacterized protein n=1 Tax=Brachionus plicatilis TaxID=10195 RepID=A0A3M7SRL0_BRAPC|nr:hypothetical protein BpHYR1_041578 [Brachionus plicatilis]